MQLIGVAELYFWMDEGSSYLFLQQLAELFLWLTSGSVPVECIRFPLLDSPAIEPASQQSANLI